MSASFTLAKPEHLDRLVALVPAFNAETKGRARRDDDRQQRSPGPALEGTLTVLLSNWPALHPSAISSSPFDGRWSLASLGRNHRRKSMCGPGVAPSRYRNEGWLAVPNALAGGVCVRSTLR